MSSENIDQPKMENVSKASSEIEVSNASLEVEVVSKTSSEVEVIPDASSEVEVVSKASSEVEAVSKASSEVEVVNSTSSVVDETDASSFYGSNGKSSKIRPVARTVTGADDDEYCMNYARRGDCIIIVHEKYKSSKVPNRDSANADARVSADAFSKLGFQVTIHKDKTTSQFHKLLEEASNKNYNDCDALVVIFMSHGDSKDGREILHTYDGEVDADSLWSPFIGNKCTTLAGKPKLFFIQACRGGKIDKGVGLRVGTDSTIIKHESSYVLPAHADILVMWASYKGMFAFKTQRHGIKGSVFIHFLAVIIEEEGRKLSLNDIILKVTRRVALDYESVNENERLTNNKQVPHYNSSLLRNVYFRPKTHK